MLKFTVLDGKVVVDPNITLFEEFQNIFKYTGNKVNSADLANRMLLYVFYCCDLTEDNPMQNVDFRMKEEEAFKRAFQGTGKKRFTKKEEELVWSAMEAYNFFNETSAERAILAIDKKIDEARTKLEEEEVEIIRNVNENTGVVSFASNENILGSIAKQIGELMTLKIQITNAAKKMENSGRVRGGKGSSIAERGSLVRRGKGN